MTEVQPESLTIRNARASDIPRVLDLLSQVLEIHARLRPDVFVSGTTKYTRDELLTIFADENRPTFVAEIDGNVVGYAFCVIKKQPFSSTMVSFTSLYIDDLCVDNAFRGQGIGSALFRHVKSCARVLGCYELTLCVWDGNDSARRFYKSLGMTPKFAMMETIL